MSDHHLAKRTISKLLKANGVHMRRQSLIDEQARDAATLYIAGRSLAWIADHFGHDRRPAHNVNTLFGRAIRAL